MLTIDTPIHLLHLLAWAIGAGTLALSAWMGLRVRRETKTTGDYLLAGRRLGKARLGAHALATRSEMPSLVSSMGVFVVWSFVVPVLLVPLIYLLAPLFRRARCYTTADFFRSRFSLGLSLTYTAIAVLILCAASSTMIVSMIGFNLTWGGMSPEYPTVLGYAAAGVVLAYTILGGLPSVVSAQMIQSAVALILTVVILGQSLSLPPTTVFHGLKGFLFKPDWLISILIVSALGLIAHPCAMTVMSTGRSETDCQTGASLGFLLRCFTQLGVLIAVGLTIARSSSGASQTVFIASIEWLLVQLVCIAALSSCFMAASALVSRNIYKDAIRNAASDAQVLFVARVSTLGFGVLAILGSWRISGFAALEYLPFGLACFGLLMVMGTVWKRGTVAGAWGSLIVMAGLWMALGPIGLQLYPVTEGAIIGSLGRPQFFPQLMLVCLPMGMVSFVGFSMISKPVAKKQLDDFYLRLKTPVGQEGRLIEAGVALEYRGDEDVAEVSLRDKAGYWKGICVVVAAMVIMSLIIAAVLRRGV